MLNILWGRQIYSQDIYGNSIGALEVLLDTDECNFITRDQYQIDLPAGQLFGHLKSNST